MVQYIDSSCATGFAHEYSPLVRYYSWVQNCTTGVTCECFQLISKSFTSNMNNSMNQYTLVLLGITPLMFLHL